SREGRVTPALRRATRLPGSRPFSHGTARGAFVAPRDGLGAIVDALARALAGCEIRVGTRVAAVTPSPARTGLDVVRGGGGTIPAAAVLIACPGSEAARIGRGMRAQLADELDGLSYASCATVSLVYPSRSLSRPLSTFGFFVPRAEGLPILACSYVSE